MRLLHATSARTRADLPPGARVGAHDLERLYTFPEKQWWRANMVATLDGRASGGDGRSGSINTPADNRVYALQRRLCDAVLVGAGTARVEGYRRVGTVGVGGIRPALVVVSASGRVPRGLVGPRDGRGAGLLVTCASAPATSLQYAARVLGADRVWVVGEDSVDLAALRDRLADNGFGRVLCEGGPRLLADLVRAGLIDELALTWSPMTVGGSGPTILAGPADATAFRLQLMLEEKGTLLGLWRTR